MKTSQLMKQMKPENIPYIGISAKGVQKSEICCENPYSLLYFKLMQFRLNILTKNKNEYYFS